MAHNLEGPTAPCDPYDHSHRSCTTDRRCRDYPGPTRAELSAPACSLASVALTGPSAASIVAPVEEVVAVVEVRVVVRRYYALVALY